MRPTKRLIADKAYDADKLRTWLPEHEIEPVIPGRAARDIVYPLNRKAYRRRNVIVAEAIGVTACTSYRWRKAVSDLTPEKLILKEAAISETAEPSRSRQCIEPLTEKHGVSERLARRVVGQHRWTQRKVSNGRDGSTGRCGPRTSSMFRPTSSSCAASRGTSVPIRSRVHREGGARLDRGGLGQGCVHQTGQPMGERLLQELQTKEAVMDHGHDLTYCTKTARRQPSSLCLNL